MSTCISKDVCCPHCGAVNKKQMWIGISAGSNPELRQKILSETLYAWKCPECGYEAELVYPLLYHDKQRGFLVLVSPSSCSCKEAAEGVQGKYPQLEDVKKRLVPSLAGLKEKILIFEAGLNDAAVEMVKSALLELVEKKRGRKALEGFFMTADRDVDYIGFAFFLDGVDKPVRQGTGLEAYEKSLEIVRSLHYTDGPDFDVVDLQLAETLLDEYQE